jgi:hypothetical protein
MFAMKAQGDEQEYERVCADALFKTYVIKIRCKEEMVNDDMRLKSTAIGIEVLDFVKESNQMYDAIMKY